MPPSAEVWLPVVKALSSEARNSATAAMSPGLLMRPSGVRAIRSAITLENLNHLYACRAPLEALAAASVAGAPWREKAVAALDLCLNQMRDAADAGDAEACFFANVALTDVFHEQNPNPVLTNLLA